MPRGEGESLALIAGVRTPFARAFGRLKAVPADDLARAVFVEALARSGIDPAELDEVILGCVGVPADAMNPARVAALRAGVPEHVPAFTVQRNCGSGLEAVASALYRAQAGAANLMLVGGAESMSSVPFQLRPESARKWLAIGNARGFAARAAGFAKLRVRDFRTRPTLQLALTDPISGLIMGDTAEVLAREYAIPREKQDEYAASSQARAVAARKRGTFAEESMPLPVPPRFKDLLVEDDGIREDATPEKLARLRPVFDRRFGTVTVGNACQLTDGAVGLVVASARRARERGLPVLALVRDCVAVGCSPRRMGLGPAVAIPRLLDRHGLTVDDVALFEINEAFAVQVLACLVALGDRAPPADKLNVNGGAIALGHPVAASGARLVLSQALELKRRGARFGIVALCVGGGQGVAALLENPEAAR